MRIKVKCLICRGFFYQEKDEKGAVCPKCRIDPNQKQEKPKQEEPTIIEEDLTEWVVVFLAVDGPKELKRIIGEKNAREFASKIYDGEIKEFNYLKGSSRLRTWTVESFDKPTGRVLLPTEQLDNLRSSDFDSSQYL